MKVIFQLEGLEELKRLFKEFPQDARIAGRQASLDAIQIGLDATRASAPRDTGLLASELAKGLLNARQARRASVDVGAQIFIRGRRKKYANNKANVRARRAKKSYVVDGPAFYGKFQEFGFTARDGSHVAGKFYMTKAMENNRAAIVQSMIDRFKPRFEQAVARRAARAKARIKRRRPRGSRR